jgi:WD40 repeat protein/tRNA A-37 threonylcarbamoyl transferase component Bud32
MNERTIFLSALEREDPVARAAYLERACAGQPALRQRVEDLLRAHEEAGTFLIESAPQQLEACERSLAFLAPPGEPGTLGRLDHYDVLEVVGRGSTGVVLKARDTKLQRVVAIKVLGPRLAASRASRQRFVREAQAAAAVRDDHVIAIYAVGDEGPVPYLVMEYIHGVTLEERVKQAGPLELKEILRIGIQVAKGLAAAHAQGVVHRDIKPANILLENHVQRVKLTDFGLARVTEDGSLAHGTVLAGTPAYMSPEQARGEASDHRSDLFSLGTVLYTLGAGRPPFQGDTTAALLQHVAEATAPPLAWANPNVPVWLGEFIGKLHAREPAERPVSAQAVADLLSRQLALLQEAPAAPDRAPPAAVPLARRRWLVAAVCLAALLVALAAVVAWLMLWHPRAADPATGAEPSASTGRVEPVELRREDIPPQLLALAGGGDPAQAPPELAAVLGDGRFLLPRIASTEWMAASPDGRVLAVPLTEDVVLFDATTGGYQRTLQGPPGGYVIRVAFSRDSRLLAATTWYAQAGSKVRVWDLDAGRELYTRQHPGSRGVCALAFSADGTRLFSQSTERLHVWDARSGRESQAVALQADNNTSLCLSPDGRRLAVEGLVGNGVKVLNWDGEKLKEVGTLQGHRFLTAAVAYSPDGKFLATGDFQEFKLWNADTLQAIRTVPVPAAELAFTPDSRVLFAATSHGHLQRIHTFRRWDVVAGEELPPLTVPVSAEPVIACHHLGPDGTTLFVAPVPVTTYVREIDPVTGKERFPRQGHVAPLNAVAVSPDGRTLASAGEDRVVKLWDLASRRVVHSLTAHTATVCGLAFSPDGRVLASGSRDGTIVLWDVSGGTELRALHGDADSFLRVQFRPDGRTVAAGGQGGLVRLWDAASGKEGEPLDWHTGVVRCVAYSRDGTLLASGGEDRTVCLHDLGHGSTRIFKAPAGVNDLAFSPDGRTLAAVGDASDAAVRLWDVETGVETTLPGHTRRVAALAFAPSAPLLATGSDDGTVRLWDYSARPPRVRTLGPAAFGGWVRGVTFTPDGRYLATANANGTVYLLRVVPPGARE